MIMKQYKIIGVQDIDYTNKSGVHVLGSSLYLSFPIVKGVGDACINQYVSFKVCDESNYIPHVGDSIRLFFSQPNREGKSYIVKIEKVDE